MPKIKDDTSTTNNGKIKAERQYKKKEDKVEDIIGKVNRAKYLAENNPVALYGSKGKLPKSNYVGGEGISPFSQSFHRGNLSGGQKKKGQNTEDVYNPHYVDGKPADRKGLSNEMWYTAWNENRMRNSHARNQEYGYMARPLRKSISDSLSDSLREGTEELRDDEDMRINAHPQWKSTTGRTGIGRVTDSLYKGRRK